MSRFFATIVQALSTAVQSQRRMWGALAQTLGGYVLPQPMLLRDEAIQLEIRLAWYRYLVPRLLFRYWWAVLLVTIALAVVLGLWAIQYGNSGWLGLFAFIAPAILFLWAARGMIEYEQWRLLITTRRTIIYRPDPDAWLGVDDIRLQAGKIQIIDPRYSPNPWWRLFQTWTGARDLNISFSGYEIKNNTAEIKIGLFFPDVMPEDINKLEEIVFPRK